MFRGALRGNVRKPVPGRVYGGDQADDRCDCSQGEIEGTPSRKDRFFISNSLKRTSLSEKVNKGRGISMTRPTRQQAAWSRLWAEERVREIEGMRDSFRDCPADVHKGAKRPGLCITCIGTSCAAMAFLGLTDDGTPLPTRLRPTCDATTRRGTPCTWNVIPGRWRCKLHGGLSTGPKTEEGRGRIAAAQKKRWAKAGVPS